MQVRHRPEAGDVFHRLVGRPVLAQTDRVVGHHIDDRHPHQRRQTDRRAAVIGEGQEGAAIGAEPAMQRDAVHRRRHAMLADAVMDVPPAVILRGDRLHALRQGVVRPGQVGRAADGLGQGGVDDLQRHLAGLAGRDLGGVLRQAMAIGRHRRVQRRRIGAGHQGAERGALRAGGQPLRPAPAHCPAPGRDLAPGGGDLGRDDEGRLGPAQFLPGRRDLVRAQGRAMHRRRALLVGCALADQRLAGDQRGARIDPGRGDRGGDGFLVVAVDGADMPAAGSEAGQLVGRGRQVGAPVDGDAVVVPEHDQPAQLLVPGEVDRLVADAFHQAAVAGDDIGVMVHQVVAEAGVHHPLGQRHADRGRDALTQRAGCGLDPLGMAVFRVPGGAAAHLAEGAQLVEPHVVIAEQVVDRVDQHRAMAGRHHEAVAVGPVRLHRVDGEEPVEQHRGDIGHAHRRAGMAGVCGLDRVHRQDPDRIGHQVLGGGGDGRLHVHEGLLRRVWIPGPGG